MRHCHTPPFQSLNGVQAMKKKRVLCRIAVYMLTPALLCALALSAHVAAKGGLPTGIIIVDTFASTIVNDDLPEGWRPLVFSPMKPHTRYSIDNKVCDSCLKAEADKAASAIYKEMDVDTRLFQILSWKWRVKGTLKNGDARTSAGDDYPARVYAAFAFEPEKASMVEKIRHQVLKSLYGVEPPGNTITYIWANKLPKGETVPNAFSNMIMMVAVESGDEMAGKWVSEERNIYEDYKRLFKEEPPLFRGVIVMTDSDNTGDKAVGWYDDIVLKKKKL